MRRASCFFVHCGFPKTGSTTLQHTLRLNETRLREAGFLYPYAGSLDRPGKASPDPSYSAHHNIAWQLMGNRKFDFAHGDLSAVREEALAFDGNLILSCEDIETSLPHPERLSPLVEIAAATDRRLIFIVYLRNQLSYCESLYIELLKHGNGDRYDTVVDSILETGCYRMRDWHYRFDYRHVLDKLKALAGAEIIVRNYHVLKSGSIIDDFCSLVGLGKVVQPIKGKAKLNTRNSLEDSLKLFYQNRLGREANRVEMLRIRHLAENRAEIFSGSAIQRRFIERFQADNLRLCEEWDVPFAGLDMTGLPRPGSAVTLEAFFSFETQCAIQSGRVPDMSFAPDRAKRTEWMSGVEAAATEAAASDVLRYWVAQGQRYRRWYTQRLKTIVIPDSAELG